MFFYLLPLQIIADFKPPTATAQILSFATFAAAFSDGLTKSTVLHLRRLKPLKLEFVL